MFFPEPVRGLSEFHRVLRPGRRAAVSVNTVVERSYNHQINMIIGRHVPSLTEAVNPQLQTSAWRFDQLFGASRVGGVMPRYFIGLLLPRHNRPLLLHQQRQ